LGFLALIAAVLDVTLEARARARARARAQATERRPARGIRPAALVTLTLTGVVCLAASMWPGSPHLVQFGKVRMTNAGYLSGMRDTEAEADRLRSRMPADAPVLYLAFGDTTYYVDHPARCRYPIATFLQRTRYLPDVTQLKSFRENENCVDHDPAPYAILDRTWFRPARVDKELWQRVTAVYDCPRSTGGATTVLCVRRTSAQPK
jgi:hypothetical protein